MVRRTLAAVAALALTATLTACSSDADADSSSTDCAPASQAILDKVAVGLTKTATVDHGAFVAIPADDQQSGYTEMLAVVLKDTHGTTRAVLATGSRTDGPILAVDHLAQLYFSWGTAATDGSGIDTWRGGLSTTAVLACL